MDATGKLHPPFTVVTSLLSSYTHSLVFACMMFLICFVLTVGILIYALNGFSYQLPSWRNRSKECVESDDLEKGSSTAPDSLSSRTSSVENNNIISPLPGKDSLEVPDPDSYHSKGKGRLVNSCITIHIEDMSSRTN